MAFGVVAVAVYGWCCGWGIVGVGTHFWMVWWWVLVEFFYWMEWELNE